MDMAFASKNQENFTAKGYVKDGRRPVLGIYAALSGLERAGWTREAVYVEVFKDESGRSVTLPILVYRTPAKGPAVWLIFGVHGEESAGPNAISENIDFIADIGEKVPMILLPLCNPKGYFLNQRYPTVGTAEFQGASVSASDFMLISEDGTPRAEKPDSPEAAAICGKVVELARDYPPIFSLDLHEDISKITTGGYVYCNSALGAEDPIAKEIVRMLGERMKMQMTGKTIFGEDLSGGIVANSKDGSIDELMNSERIILNGKIVAGPSAKTAIVIETKILGIPIETRIGIHSEIIRAIPEFMALSEKV